MMDDVVFYVKKKKICHLKLGITFFRNIRNEKVNETVVFFRRELSKHFQQRLWIVKKKK